MHNLTVRKTIKRVTACILAAALSLANPVWDSSTKPQNLVLASDGDLAETETETETMQEPEQQETTSDDASTEKETVSVEVPETESEPAAETEAEEEQTEEKNSETNLLTEKNEDPETEIKETEIKETETKETETTESQTEETETETEGMTEETDFRLLCSCMEESEDPLDHDPDCPYFLHGLLQYCDCGCLSENIEDHDEECMCRQLLRQMEEEADLVETYAKELTPSGVPIASASGWKKVTSDYIFSSVYSPVKFYSGITQVQTFANSPSVVEGKLAPEVTYLYPTKSGLGGSFGILYKKVLYQNYKWYDLRMTIVNYTTSVNCDNSKTAESYPYLCTKIQNISWNFNQALGGLVAKCEFLETGTNTKAAVNTRFQWWDIDAAQRFGIKTADGTISGRYYYEGSEVYVAANQNIAGMGGMELVIGQGANTDENDPRYCVTYELNNCSCYYMSFGERDHMESDDYSYAKSNVEAINANLATGTYESVRDSEFLFQTDTSLAKIDTPEPQKKVSEDGNTWKTECTLKTCDSAFWYQINQFVPWQDKDAYYESFVIKDQLQTGVQYKGELKVIRNEDQKIVTDQFVVSEKDGALTISTKSTFTESAAFYGYHYSIVFKAGMIKEKITPQKQQNKMIYTVTNKGSIIYKHKGVGSYTEKISNEVKTMAEIIRTDAPAPKKGIDGDEGIVQKTIMMENETITFSVFQEIPENDSIFYPLKITMEDNLEECLEYCSLEVGLQKKSEKEFLKTESWNVNANGQKITANGELDAQYNGGKIRFQICCKIKKNFNLQKWKTGQPDGGIWVRIPNKASVSFVWNGETPVKKNTNIAEVKLRENHIRLKKEIDVSDIVWAHGEPTFTFKVSGKDLDGKEHFYYQTVVFQQNNITNGSKAYLEADFIVPAGIYAASEEKTMRYQLEQIYEIINGTGESGQVVFDLSKGMDGSACFYNKKITDGEESHTDFVRNKIFS